MCGAQGSICTELVGRISEHSGALAAAVAAAAEVAERLPPARSLDCARPVPGRWPNASSSSISINKRSVAAVPCCYLQCPTTYDSLLLLAAGNETSLQMNTSLKSLPRAVCIA